MIRVAGFILCFLLAGVCGQGRAVIVDLDTAVDERNSAEIRQCLRTAYQYYYSGRYFWAVEYWQRVLRLDPGQQTAKKWCRALYDGCAVKLGQIAVGQITADQRSLLGIAPPESDEERTYLKTLQSFLEEDYQTAWTGWMTLSRFSDYGDEMEWLLLGPHAGLYQSEWPARRQMALKFHDRYRERNGRTGSALASKKSRIIRDDAVFTQAGGRSAPAHLLTIVYADDGLSQNNDELEISFEQKMPVADPLVGLDRSYQERYQKALAFYLEGLWKEASVWFRSALNGSEKNSVAAKAHRRLAWLYPVKRTDVVARVLK